MGICEGRVVVITGAGGGIGREHALEFARQGARVVVNDLRGADEVVAELREFGAEAIASTDDVADYEGARQLVEVTVERYGRLDTLVNNAGILRDKMLVNMDAEHWDSVIRVHLRGTFCPTRHAAEYWRARRKEGDDIGQPRVINTSSPSGLFGNVGQTNYGAAKAGIAGFTVIAADELARLGVTVNAIAPTALTEMTAGLSGYVSMVEAASAESGFDVGSPANISPLVVWLGSDLSAGITGRVFTVNGGVIGIAETWRVEHKVTRNARWAVEDLTEAIPDLVAKALPNSTMAGLPRLRQHV